MAISDALYRASAEKCPGYVKSAFASVAWYEWKVALLTTALGLATWKMLYIMTLHVVGWALSDISHPCYQPFS